MNCVHFVLVLSQLISHIKCNDHNTKLLDHSRTKNDNNVVSQVEHVAELNTGPAGQKFTNEDGEDVSGLDSKKEIHEMLNIQTDIYNSLYEQSNVAVATIQLLAVQRFKDDISKKNRPTNYVQGKRNMRTKRDTLLQAQSVDKGTGCYLLYNKERNMFLTVSDISLPPEFEICDDTRVHYNRTNKKCYMKGLYSSNIPASNCNLEPEQVLNLCFIFSEEKGELHPSYHCKVPLEAMHLHRKLLNILYTGVSILSTYNNIEQMTSACEVKGPFCWPYLVNNK